MLNGSVTIPGEINKIGGLLFVCLFFFYEFYSLDEFDDTKSSYQLFMSFAYKNRRKSKANFEERNTSNIEPIQYV